LAAQVQALQEAKKAAGHTSAADQELTYEAPGRRESFTGVCISPRTGGKLAEALKRWPSPRPPNAPQEDREATRADASEEPVSRLPALLSSSVCVDKENSLKPVEQTPAVSSSTLLDKPNLHATLPNRRISKDGPGIADRQGARSQSPSRKPKLTTIEEKPAPRAASPKPKGKAAPAKPAAPRKSRGGPVANKPSPAANRSPKREPAGEAEPAVARHAEDKPRDRRSVTPRPQRWREKSTQLTIAPDLSTLTSEELREVVELEVSNPGVGSIIFHGITDCSTLDIERLVHLDVGEVLVYPCGNKPSPGMELNKRATVTMYQCWPPNGRGHLEDESAQERYRGKIKQMTEDKRATFIDYDCSTGTWVFQVEHF